MSSWIDSAKWAKYLSKEGCLVCNQTSESRPPMERPIADLSVSRFVADRDTCLEGHCCLVLKPHVIEVYELSDEESAAFMRDVKVASLALKRATGAVKLNYEIQDGKFEAFIERMKTVIKEVELEQGATPDTDKRCR